MDAGLDGLHQAPESEKSRPEVNREHHYNEGVDNHQPVIDNKEDHENTQDRQEGVSLLIGARKNGLLAPEDMEEQLKTWIWHQGRIYPPF